MFSFSHPNDLLRSGENDVEYSSNMELEEEDFMEDAAAAAATPGASGMKSSLQNSHTCETLLDSFRLSSWKQHQAVFCRQFYFGKYCIMWFGLMIAAWQKCFIGSIKKSRGTLLGICLFKKDP